MLNRVTIPLALRMLDRDSERFDARHGVDTASWTTLDEVTVDDGSVGDGRPYVPTPPRLLRAMLRSCIADPRGWTFVDFGSGRGRALILAALYGFERVIGVEFARELHEGAVRNVEIMARRTPGALAIEPVHADATRFELPAGPLALFFNNPFTGAVFDGVLSNIEESHRDDPRPMVVFYQTMRSEDPGQAASENHVRLARSAELTEMPVRFRNPIDAVALRPFDLRAYATAEVTAGPAGVGGADAVPEVATPAA